MKFYLNKSFTAELEIMKALQKYLSDIDIRGLYGRVTINVTNDHPFAQLANGMITGSGKINTSGVFPAIVVTTAADSKSAKLAIGQSADAAAIMCKDTQGMDDYQVTPKVLADIGGFIEANGKIYGAQYLFRRKDDISIEIWAENIQLKNELYDIVKMFVLNIRDTALGAFVERNAVMVFDETVHGDRSNNYNFDFGVTLAGSNITFEIEYCNEIVILDTDLKDTDIDFIAKNHSQNAVTEDEIMPEEPAMLGRLII